MDGIDRNHLLLMALKRNLAALSPDNGDIAGRLTIRAADGAHVADILLSSKDLDALNDAVAELGATAQQMRQEAVVAAEDAVLSEADQMLLELDSVTPWDATDADKPVPFVPGARVSPPSNAALWAANNPSLAADLADVFNAMDLSDPAGDEDGER